MPEIVETSEDGTETRTSSSELTICMLQVISEARRRACVYFRKFYDESRHQVKRAEKDAPVSLLHVTERQKKASMTKREIQATSTDVREINEACTKPQLKRELDTLRPLHARVLPNSGKVPKFGNVNKPVLVNALCKFRKEYFDADLGERSEFGKHCDESIKNELLRTRPRLRSCRMACTLSIATLTPASPRVYQ